MWLFVFTITIIFFLKYSIVIIVNYYKLEACGRERGGGEKNMGNNGHKPKNIKELSKLQQFSDPSLHFWHLSLEQGKHY